MVAVEEWEGRVFEGVAFYEVGKRRSEARDIHASSIQWRKMSAWVFGVTDLAEIHTLDTLGT